MSLPIQLLHVIAAPILSNQVHGAYKDVISRVRFFEQFPGLDYSSCTPEALDHEDARGRMLDGKTHLLIEYSDHGRLVQAIRAANPALSIAVRSHNVEPLQHLANYGWWPARGPLWMLYGMGRLLWKDALSRRHADRIFSINEWENRHYWRRLPGRAKIVWLPYYCPDHLIAETRTPTNERKTIACLPAGQKNRKSLDLVNRFDALAESMSAQSSNYEFVVTGTLDAWDLSDHPAVKRIGFVDDLSAFLTECKAVAMMSPLGYGFKTTLMDALASGAGIIAHPDLLHRCPEEVQELALGVDRATCDPASVSDYLNGFQGERGRALNREVQARNHQLLADWLSPGPAKEAADGV